MDIALSRPWLVWGFGTVVLLLAFELAARVIGWPPYLDSCVIDMSCYCEKFDLDLAVLQANVASGTAWKGVMQPINTYSNLYAVGTALLVAGFMWNDRRTQRTTGVPANVMMSKWWVGDVWVFCVLFLGLGSMWFHGSISSKVSWFDSFSMYVFTGFLVYYTLDRVLIQMGKTELFRSLMFGIGYPLTAIGFTIIGAIKGDDGLAVIPSEILIGILVAVYIGFEHWAKFLWDWKPMSWWFSGLLSFGLAALFRALSTKPDDPLCTPDSWFQPHGLLWHVMSGGMAVCLYFYWRCDKGGVGKLSSKYQ